MTYDICCDTEANNKKMKQQKAMKQIKEKTKRVENDGKETNDEIKEEK